MKTIKLLAAIIMLITYPYFANAGVPVWEKELKPVIKVERTKALPMRMHRKVSPPARDMDCCRDYKGKQIAGFIILPVGIGFVAGGSYMAYTAAKRIIDEVTNAINVFPERSKGIAERDIGMVAVGTGMAIVGAALIPTGLAMGIRGSIKTRKFCNNNYYTERKVYIAPSSTGTGLTFTF